MSLQKELTTFFLKIKDRADDPEFVQHVINELNKIHRFPEGPIYSERAGKLVNIIFNNDKNLQKTFNPEEILSLVNYCNTMGKNLKTQKPRGRKG